MKKLILISILMVLGCSNESDEFAVVCESQLQTSYYNFSPDEVTEKSFPKMSREELEEKSGMDTSAFGDDFFEETIRQYELYEYTPGYVSFGVSTEYMELKWVLNRSSLTLTTKQEMKGPFKDLGAKPISVTTQCSSPTV